MKRIFISRLNIGNSLRHLSLSVGSLNFCLSLFIEQSKFIGRRHKYTTLTEFFLFFTQLVTLLFQLLSFRLLIFLCQLFCYLLYLFVNFLHFQSSYARIGIGILGSRNQFITQGKKSIAGFGYSGQH